MTEAVLAVKNTCYGCSIVGVGVLTQCASVHCVYDLKAAQINMQCCLIHKLRLYEFKLGHNTMEATKNICKVKFFSGCKNLEDR